MADANDDIWSTPPDQAAARIEELNQDLANAEAEQWEDWEIDEVHEEIDILRQVIANADSQSSLHDDAVEENGDGYSGQLYPEYPEEEGEELEEEEEEVLEAEEEAREEEVVEEQAWEYQELEEDEFNLIYAAEDGDIETLRGYLDDGIDPNILDEEGFTPLIYAAVGGSADCVELLLDYNVDPNMAGKDESKSTALHVAAQNGDSDCVKVLLLFKANVDMQLAAGSTALTLAAQDGALDVVEKLLEARASVDPVGGHHISALYIAAQHRQKEVIKSLMAAGADPVRVATQTRHSPLSAIMTVWKDFVTLETFLDIDPHLVDKKINGGETPLEHAVFGAIEAEKGSEDGQYWRKVISLLLQHKAKPNVVIQPQNEADFPTTLLIAAIEQNVDQILLKELVGEEPNVAAPGGYTPLHMTAEMADMASMQCLLDAKAKVNVTTEEGGEDGGLTPLHLAVQNGSPAIVELLLKHKASVNSPRGGQQLSALNMAISKRPLSEDSDVPTESSDIFRMLMSAKADVGDGGDDVPPLLLACSLHLWGTTVALLDAGADVNQIHAEESTPLTIAMMNLLEAMPPLEEGAEEGEEEADNEAVEEALILVETLLAAKADVDLAPDPGGRTPLHMTRNMVSRSGGIEGVDTSKWGRDAADQIDHDLKPLSFRTRKVLEGLLAMGGDIDLARAQELKIQAAIGIQRILRGRIAKAEVKEMWRRQSASLVLQRFAFRARQKTAMRRLRTGMLKLQNLARGREARRRTEKIRRRRAVENKAAASIQNEFRPMLQKLVAKRRAQKAEEERLARLKRQEESRLRHAKRILDAQRKKARDEVDKLNEEMDMARMDQDRDKMISVHKRLKEIEAEWHFNQHAVEDKTLRPVLSTTFAYLKSHCADAMRASKLASVVARAPEIVPEDVTNESDSAANAAEGDTNTESKKELSGSKSKDKHATNSKIDKQPYTETTHTTTNTNTNTNTNKPSKEEDDPQTKKMKEIDIATTIVNDHMQALAKALATCEEAGTTSKELVAQEAAEAMRLLKGQLRHFDSLRKQILAQADAEAQSRKNARHKTVKAAIFKQKRRKKKKKKKKKTNQEELTPDQKTSSKGDNIDTETEGQPEGDGGDTNHPKGEKDTKDHPEGEKDTKDQPKGDKDTKVHPEGNKDTKVHPEGNKDTKVHSEGDKDTKVHPEGDKDTKDHPESDKSTKDHPEGDKNTKDHPESDKGTKDHPEGDKNTKDHPEGDKNIKDHPEGEEEDQPEVTEPEVTEPEWSDAFSEVGMQHLREQGPGSDDVFAADFVPHPDRIRYRMLLHQSKRLAAARRKKIRQQKRAIALKKKTEKEQRRYKQFELAKRQISAKRKKRKSPSRSQKSQVPTTPPLVPNQVLLAHPRGEVIIWSNPSEPTTSNYTEPEEVMRKEVRKGREEVVSRMRVSPMPFEEARAMVHQLALANRSRWLKWCSSFKRPPDLPMHPDKTYKKQWVSWSDWLGLGASTTRYGLSTKRKKFLLPAVSPRRVSTSHGRRKKAPNMPVRPSTSHGTSERPVLWEFFSA